MSRGLHCTVLGGIDFEEQYSIGRKRAGHFFLARSAMPVVAQNAER